MLDGQMKSKRPLSIKTGTFRGLCIVSGTQLHALTRRNRQTADSRKALAHTILFPEFVYGVGYFFPLSLKFSAK
jgi:hypothetical protein